MATPNQQKEAVDWFMGKARTAAGYRQNLFKNNPERHRSTATQGRMYFFHYDPKTKDKLPIYDRFPLVFPLNSKPGGFLGLNVHYLLENQRLALLSEMMEYASNKRNDETTKIKLDYDMARNVSGIASFMGECVKRYLYSHVRSPFVEITANEWEKVITLPTELFITKR